MCSQHLDEKLAFLCASYCVFVGTHHGQGQFQTSPKDLLSSDDLINHSTFDQQCRVSRHPHGSFVFSEIFHVYADPHVVQSTLCRCDRLIVSYRKRTVGLMLTHVDSPAFHCLSHLMYRLMSGNVNRDALVLERSLKEREDQLAFCVDVGVEQNGVIMRS